MSKLESYMGVMTAPSEVNAVRKGSAEWAERVRKEAVYLSELLNRAYIRMSVLVYTAYSEHIGNDNTKPPLWAHWGYKSLYDWAYTELGFRKRKVDFLKKIYYVIFVELERMPEPLRARICALDYSKVRELVSVLTVDNATRWAELAETYAYDDLCKHLVTYRRDIRAAITSQGVKDDPRSLKSPDPREAPGVHVPIPAEERSTCLKLYLYPHDLKVVKKAVEVSAKISSSPYQSYNIGLICLDFLATNGGAIAGTESLVHYFQNLDRIFGVRTVVFERRLPGRDDNRPPEIFAGAQNLLELTEAIKRFYPPTQAAVRATLSERLNLDDRLELLKADAEAALSGPDAAIARSMLTELLETA